MWSTMISPRHKVSGHQGAVPSLNQILQRAGSLHTSEVVNFQPLNKQWIIEENNNLHIHKVLNNLWDILNLHLAFDIRQHLDEMVVFHQFFVALQRLDLPGIFSSWWYQPIWEISVKLHHLPKDRCETERMFATTTYLVINSWPFYPLTWRSPTTFERDHVFTIPNRLPGLVLRNSPEKKGCFNRKYMEIHLPTIIFHGIC